MYILVTQSFGRESEYRRALFAILSFWAWYKGDKNIVKTCLFTDNPDFFKPFLKNIEVEYILLTAGKIASMRGEIDFLHRIKICLIEETFARNKGAKILYIDSDTFFVRDPTPWMLDIVDGRSFMHLMEYKFEESRHVPMPTYHAFLDLIENQTFITSHGEKKVGLDLESWNAGVMGLPSSVAEMLPDVYSLTEQFYPPTAHNTCEQYAFSLILKERTDLRPCSEYVYHYWENGEKITADYILENLFAKTFTSEAHELLLNKVKSLTIQLPDLFQEHVLALRDKALQAFSHDNFSLGYKFAWRAFKKGPINGYFFKDVLYHAKRHLKNYGKD